MCPFNLIHMYISFCSMAEMSEIKSSQSQSQYSMTKVGKKTDVPVGLNIFYS